MIIKLIKIWFICIKNCIQLQLITVIQSFREKNAIKHNKRCLTICKFYSNIDLEYDYRQ